LLIQNEQAFSPPSLEAQTETAGGGARDGPKNYRPNQLNGDKRWGGGSLTLSERNPKPGNRTLRDGKKKSARGKREGLSMAGPWIGPSISRCAEGGSKKEGELEAPYVVPTYKGGKSNYVPAPNLPGSSIPNRNSSKQRLSTCSEAATRADVVKTVGSVCGSWCQIFRGGGGSERGGSSSYQKESDSPNRLVATCRM